MNSVKYRKIVLVWNWKDNQFIMIKEKNNKPKCFPCPYSINFQRNHPKVLSGEAFWTTHNELCVGYHLVTNPDIFRPIFSHKRQRLLDKVHYGKKEDEEDQSVYFSSFAYNPNLRYARKKYLVGLDEVTATMNITRKKIPMECLEIILSFIPFI